MNSIFLITSYIGKHETQFSLTAYILPNKEVFFFGGGAGGGMGLGPSEAVRSVGAPRHSRAVKFHGALVKAKVMIMISC